MKIIDRPRYEGKTTKLVSIMLQPGNEDVIYVAPTMQRATLAHGLAQRMAAGLTPAPSRSRFISLDRVGAQQRRSRFVVDDADTILQALLGGETIAAAFTSDGNETA